MEKPEEMKKEILDTIKFEPIPDDPEQPKLEGELSIKDVIGIAEEIGVIDSNKVDEDDHSAEGEKNWMEFVKNVKLYDIIDDQLRRAFRAYEKEYNKRNAEDGDISVKLHLGKRNVRNGVAFAAGLKLEVKRRGLYKVFSDKQLGFTHVRDVRDETTWKYKLYEAMLQDLIFHGLNHLLLKDDVQNGFIKPKQETDGATTKRKSKSTKGV
jgi:hypothetical protein